MPKKVREYDTVAFLLSEMPEEAQEYDTVASIAISDAYKGAGVRSCRHFCGSKRLKKA